MMWPSERRDSRDVYNQLARLSSNKSHSPYSLSETVKKLEKTLRDDEQIMAFASNSTDTESWVATDRRLLCIETIYREDCLRKEIRYNNIRSIRTDARLFSHSCCIIIETHDKKRRYSWSVLENDKIYSGIFNKREANKLVKFIQEACNAATSKLTEDTDLGMGLYFQCNRGVSPERVKSAIAEFIRRHPDQVSNEVDMIQTDDGPFIHLRMLVSDSKDPERFKVEFAEIARRYGLR